MTDSVGRSQATEVNLYEMARITTGGGDDDIKIGV